MTLTIWDGDSKNRDSDNAPQKAPNSDDFNRMLDEVVTMQTKVDSDNAGYDDGNTIDTIGTVATKTGLSSVEKGDGAVHKTVFTLTAVALTSTIGTNDRPYTSQALYTFPDGHILIHGVHVQFPVAGIACTTGGGTGYSDTADIEVGVGTAATTDTADNGLNNGDEEDVMGALDVNLTAKTSDAIVKGIVSAAAVVDGHGAGKTYYLNSRCIGADDHGVTPDILSFTGVVTIVWSNLGDNG